MFDLPALSPPELRHCSESADCQWKRWAAAPTRHSSWAISSCSAYSRQRRTGAPARCSAHSWRCSGYRGCQSPRTVCCESTIGTAASHIIADVPILPARLTSIQDIHRPSLLVIPVIVPEALTKGAIDRRVKVRDGLLKAVSLVLVLCVFGGSCKVVLGCIAILSALASFRRSVTYPTTPPP